MLRDYGSGTPFGAMRSQDVTSTYDTRTDRLGRARPERVMTGWGLDVLFNPSKRHMDEEKRRLQSTREEVGDSSGGKRIDFESGKVVISRPSANAATADAIEDEIDGDEIDGVTAEHTTADEIGEDEPA